MRIEPAVIETVAKELYIRALKILPPDVKQGFDALAAAETAPTAQSVLSTMIRNIAVAEATIALTLLLQKRIKHNEAKLRRGEWAQRGDRGEFLFGKTVGLVGLGRVGSHVARRLVN